MFGLKLSSRIIFDILFIYQLYDIFNDHFHYKYSIELDFDVNSRILPSITICIDKRHDSSYLWKHWKNPFGNQTIVCFYYIDLKHKLQECNEEKVYLRYRHKETCLTFFNNKTDNYYKIQSESIDMLLSSFIYTQQKVIIHPPNTLSHFEINNVFVAYGYKYNNFHIKKVTRSILPKPYLTDCHDYSQDSISSLSPRSQSYCMFEYMRKEELNKCREYIYWNQYVIFSKNQVMNFKNESSNECIAKFNYKLLSRLCKIDCINDKYIVSHNKFYSDFANPNTEIPIRKQYNINLSYNPKMTIVQLCSNLGGLISMYFGLSMIDIIIITSAKLLQLRWSKVMKIIITMIFKYLIKIIFYIMMLYQLIMIIKTYIEENRKIKISFTNEIKLNKIALCIETTLDFNRNNEYFPEFKDKYKLSFYNDRYKLVHDHIYNVFLQNLSSFIYITRLFDRKIDCSMEFENNIQLDCGKIILS